ncbi:MAG TPA: hypothetical protein VHG92_00040, partial [Afifellaceae bacterium]|nr:hypothetical protein [Afifellaceae bacterium]
MTRQFLSVSLAALLVAGGGLAAAQAQQGQGGPMGQQGGPGMEQPDRQVDRPAGEARADRERRGGRHGMRGHGYRHGMMHHRGMRGGGMHREHTMRTLIIL